LSDITFRRYEMADHDAVWEVFRATSAQLGFRVGAWDGDFHHLYETYIDPGGEFMVGECDEQIVAFGGLERTSATRARVRRVGVDPEFQRRGFGTALMVELERLAVAVGIETLYLDTSMSQIAAQGLYRACGYREVGRVVMGGVECMVFEKEIGEQRSED
jgi:ribosomal protein S18 acetylase RimI-like enzyme